MNFRYIFVVLFCLADSAVYVAKKQENRSNFEIPYICREGSKEVELFVGFGCHFCHESIRSLKSYLGGGKKICLRIYYFMQYSEDREKVIYFLAAESNLDDILALSEIFLHLSKKKQRVKLGVFLKKRPEIVARCAAKAREYNSICSKMQARFLEVRVECVPTWIINNTYIIEGPIDDVDRFFRTL